MAALSTPSVGNVTNGFDAAPALPGSPRHRGIDYGWANGKQILAAAPGVVAYAGPGGVTVRGTWIDSTYGNVVVIDHRDGMLTIYAHIRDDGFLVGTGDEVSRRQQIAWMGATGKVDGTHLHFEVRVNGVVKNPSSYFTVIAGDGEETIEEEEMANKAIQVRNATTGGISAVIPGLMWLDLNADYYVLWKARGWFENNDYTQSPNVNVADNEYRYLRSIWEPRDRVDVAPEIDTRVIAELKAAIAAGDQQVVEKVLAGVKTISIPAEVNVDELSEQLLGNLGPDLAAELAEHLTVNLGTR